MRTLIVHYHIFKNAGTSIERILSCSFGARFGTFEGPTPTSILPPMELAHFAQRNAQLVAVSSHQLRPPAPEGLRILPFVLVRQPLDRAYSIYCHNRRESATFPSIVAARRMGFKDYVAWCLDHPDEGGVVMTNYQVIHLSEASFRNGGILRATAIESDLSAATQYLAASACFGAVDEFPAAVDRFCLAASANGLPLIRSIPHENVTAGRPDSLQQRLGMAEAELGQALCERFKQENELDQRLYAWVSQCPTQGSLG
jgi:hypothetical protein